MALRVEQILGTRLFPDQFSLSKWLLDCYFGRILTRAIERCVTHSAKYVI
jgi:hypothetical protein